MSGELAHERFARAVEMVASGPEVWQFGLMLSLERRPEEVVRRAIKGMLPKNRLGRAIAGKLKVYTGPNHPHAAQQPQPFEIKKVAQ